MLGVAGALPTVFTTRFASVSVGAWLLNVQSDGLSGLPCD